MNAQYRLKEDWKPVGSSEAAKRQADWMNAIARQFNRAEVVSGGTARPTELGFRIEVDSDGSSASLTFSCSLASPVVTVTLGSIWFADAQYAVAEDTVTLTGATEYVYVWHNKDHSDSGIDHSSTPPISNGNRWIWVLCTYTVSAGVWTLSSIRHRGDVHAYLPMR